MKMKFTMCLMVSVIMLIISGCLSKEEEKKDNVLKTFVVDEAYCNAFGVPIIHFSCSYSSKFVKSPPVEGQQNEHYMAFNIEDANGKLTEGIALNHLTFTKGMEVNEDILIQTLKMSESAMKYNYGFEITESNIGSYMINGKKCLMWRGKGKATALRNEYKGNYLLQNVLFLNGGTEKNGLFIMLFANENSAVKSFEDFNTKGYVSHVLKTLKIKD